MVTQLVVRIISHDITLKPTKTYIRIGELGKEIEISLGK